MYKMATNLIECSRLEQKSVIKFLAAEICKSCEIYRWMCDVYTEEYSSQKIFTKRLKMGLPLWAWDKKIRNKTHWLSSKEKVPGVAVKKVMLTVFLDKKGHITFDFLKRCATVNKASYCQILQ